MTEEHLLDEIKRYVAFGPEDEARLRGLAGRMLPRFPEMAEDFYDHILHHEGAKKAITGGQEQVERLKGTLRAWMRGLVEGPWDEAYYQLRARIGRRHVQINLPQQYMFTAINVIRLHFLDAILESTPDVDEARRDMRAVDKILDIELAIMLHTYREDYLAQMQRNERLATFGQLVASIGHELRNPLGVMESSLFLMRGRIADDRVMRHIEKIGGQIKLANRIVSDLLDMVRDKPAQRRMVTPQDIVASALELVAHTGTRITVELQGLPPVRVDPDQLRQVFVNLISNGEEAAGADGEVRVAGRVDGSSVALLVNDSGPGVDPTIRGRLFEPLVTTKARGIGLGLALCRRLVERNGGTIQLSAGPLPGAAFEVRLPTEASK
jgi:two-component system sensor histidine kinase HydH